MTRSKNKDKPSAPTASTTPRQIQWYNKETRGYEWRDERDPEVQAGLREGDEKTRAIAGEGWRERDREMESKKERERERGDRRERGGERERGGKIEKRKEREGGGEKKKRGERERRLDREGAGEGERGYSSRKNDEDGDKDRAKEKDDYAHGTTRAQPVCKTCLPNPRSPGCRYTRRGNVHKTRPRYQIPSAGSVGTGYPNPNRTWVPGAAFPRHDADELDDYEEAPRPPPPAGIPMCYCNGGSLPTPCSEAACRGQCYRDYYIATQTIYPPVPISFEEWTRRRRARAMERTFQALRGERAMREKTEPVRAIEGAPAPLRLEEAPGSDDGSDKGDTTSRWGSPSPPPTSSKIAPRTSAAAAPPRAVFSGSVVAHFIPATDLAGNAVTNSDGDKLGTFDGRFVEKCTWMIVRIPAYSAYDYESKEFRHQAKVFEARGLILKSVDGILNPFHGDLIAGLINAKEKERPVATRHALFETFLNPSRKVR
ncbi:uncharacterized protein EI97DRAFT_480408 [Westerdykella ornata]|uniref:Uncharacterized protein n=1 Tax=Westerdykella ornata TaxID=318751 RepID=A0A6A6JBC8_WESOR|nr:uncharacterized protein EI97DRAFT_480408 [Westerdykella ornata]KAF2273504.1 hypothetical protein EI97DRAFT_480408 [Westerdykella ornata]